jgi:hypothetical protein
VVEGFCSFRYEKIILPELLLRLVWPQAWLALQGSSAGPGFLRVLGLASFYERSFLLWFWAFSSPGSFE